MITGFVFSLHHGEDLLGTELYSYHIGVLNAPLLNLREALCAVHPQVHHPFHVELSATTPKLRRALTATASPDIERHLTRGGTLPSTSTETARRRDKSLLPSDKSLLPSETVLRRVCVDNMRDAFAYLKTLEPDVQDRLYQCPWTCQAQFRALPPLAKQYVC